MIANHRDVITKRSQSCSSGAKICLIMAISPPRAYFFAVRPEAGSAEGALMLGTTFDPVELRRLGAIGARPDLAKVRQWYQRAAELGSSAASQQLAGLSDGH